MPNNNGTSSSAEINNSIEPILFNSTDIDTGTMNVTDASALPNEIDFSDDGIRVGRNLDYFPNRLASMIKNDPIAYIRQYKVSINKFADELVTHQQQYGLSECLFEPLHKVGDAFTEFYGQNPQKQALVNRYFKFISNLKNTTHIDTPANCSIAEINPSSSSTTQATTEFTTQSTTATTPIISVNETFTTTNTTAHANDINPN